MPSWFKRYLLPGLVFQSISIAGGYGTGRELAEFFLKFGPVGGLLGLILPTTILVSVVCMVSFELARIAKTYDYKSFIKLILGRGWFIYEISFLTSVILVLAVIGAATSSLIAEAFGIPGVLGTAVLLVTIAFLTFKGTKVIEGVLSVWSFVLYAVYLSVFVVSFAKFGGAIQDTIAASLVIDGWFLSGLRYASLQLALIPAVLFATTHITRRKEALIAGALTGPILVTPAILFFIAMIAHYPAILEESVPVYYILQTLDSRALQVCFQLVLLGTFIETGTGMIHAFNERIAGAVTASGRTLPAYLRPLTALVLIVLALLMSRLGLIDLIAVGYGTMTWIFIGIFILPLLTVGVWKITRQQST
jgi:uncharacterized membrane protein YkvI